MKADLAQAQWFEVTQGHLTAPDGSVYWRRSTSTKRRTCDEVMDSGAPLVLYYWAGGQLDWFDGPDAHDAWKHVRGSFTQKSHPVWTAGLWERGDGQQLVLMTGQC